MAINKKIIPPDSFLHSWLAFHENTEVPTSYLVVTGLSVLGALLKRNVWVDQDKWKVFPNQSVMLIGPSGVGKDTAINFGKKFLEKYNIIPVIGGRTIEGLYYRLASLSEPAAAFIPAGELTAYLGGKEYQKSMVQDLTDLLSTNDKMDISTKTDMVMSGAKFIRQPTITMHCGSTVEWLHKAMPEGSLEGGFLGRFLIVIEELGARFVPLPKYEIHDAHGRKHMKVAQETWYGGCERVLERTKGWGEVFLLEEAQFVYQNWYINRFGLFSKAVMPYANRCRDAVLRMGMLMGLTRHGVGWIDEVDVQFGVDILHEVARGIEKVVLPPTREAQCGEEILRLLPTTHKNVVKTLGRKFDLRTIQSAEVLLETGGDIKRVGELWVKETR